MANYWHAPTAREAKRVSWKKNNYRRLHKWLSATNLSIMKRALNLKHKLELDAHNLNSGSW